MFDFPSLLVLLDVNTVSLELLLNCDTLKEVEQGHQERD